MGRPKKPIEEHKRQGTYQPCRHAGPEPEITTPEQPQGLTERAAKFWSEVAPILERNGVFTECDGESLRLMCESYAGYAEARDTIQEEGMFITQVNKGGNSYLTEHPAAKARARHWKELFDMLKQFGMTPASRTGLHVGKKEENEMSDLAKILKGSRN